MVGGSHSASAFSMHLKASLFSFVIFKMLFITILSSNGHNIMQHTQAFKSKFLPDLHTDKKCGYLCVCFVHVKFAFA